MKRSNAHRDGKPVPVGMFACIAWRGINKLLVNFHGYRLPQENGRDYRCAAFGKHGATKAAIHSYTESLRHQLRNTAVEVPELAPPAVATDLMPGHRENPHRMPLEDFIRESIERMENATGGILVDRIKPLRNAESSGQYQNVFGMLNQVGWLNVNPKHLWVAGRPFFGKDQGVCP